MTNHWNKVAYTGRIDWNISLFQESLQMLNISASGSGMQSCPSVLGLQPGREKRNGERQEIRERRLSWEMTEPLLPPRTDDGTYVREAEICLSCDQRVQYFPAFVSDGVDEDRDTSDHGSRPQVQEQLHHPHIWRCHLERRLERSSIALGNGKRKEQRGCPQLSNQKVEGNGGRGRKVS